MLIQHYNTSYYKSPIIYTGLIYYKLFQCWYNYIVWKYCNITKALYHNITKGL